MQDMAGNGPQTAVEHVAWPPTEQVLGQKKQLEKQFLGDKPVSVIKGNNARDYQQVYDAGVAAGNGTDEQRRIVSEMISGMEAKDLFLQKELLKLSSVSRFVQLEKPGHLVILEEPEAVAQEVEWVLKARK